MTRIRTYTALAALAAAVALVLAACGGGGGDGSSGAASASGGMNAADTVSVMNVKGVGDVLVDSAGAALYASDEEAGGDVLCTDACAAIWIPLTVPAGNGGPTAAGDLASDLGVAKRPDGAEQVTFDGRRLYTFADDPGPGQVTGDGFSDKFGGTHFTWHVASPTGFSGGSTSPDDGYGY
ncbi:MAG: COG4315 family predicted lipoprotein [Gaiellaceae bacterium]